MKMEIKNMNILQDLKKQHRENRLDFNPNIAAHRKDYVALEHGRPTVFKYNLKSPQYRKPIIYLDTLTMMRTETSLWACRDE